MRIASIDTETTGTNVKTDRVVQFGWTTSTGKSGSFYINPGIPMPAGAQAVHGITDEMLAAAEPFAAVAGKIKASLEKADVIVGYNILAFDIPILQAELERCGMTWAPRADQKVIDPFLIFSRQYPKTLTGAIKFFCGFDHVGAHDALDDAVGCFEVFKAQLKNAGDIDALAAQMFDPNAVDRAGKLVRDGEIVRLSFGKHQGKDVREVPNSYYAWCLREGVLGEDAIRFLKGVL
jgi:DNA polymerase-3 subunit epsilon